MRSGVGFIFWQHYHSERDKIDFGELLVEQPGKYLTRAIVGNLPRLKKVTRIDAGCYKSLQVVAR